MPATEAELLARFDELGIATKTYRHPPLHTVEKSRKLRGDLPGGHCKSLFLKDKKGQLWLLVTLEDREVDLKTLPMVSDAGLRHFPAVSAAPRHPRRVFATTADGLVRIAGVRGLGFKNWRFSYDTAGRAESSARRYDRLLKASRMSGIWSADLMVSGRVFCAAPLSSLCRGALVRLQRRREQPDSRA